MLRVKKPQPEALSGYIRKRLNKRQRRKLQVQVLEKEHKRLAQDEDAWEAIIKRQGILESGTAHETTYKAGVQGVLREIGSRIALENKKHLIYARRMQEIVLKERRLALREKRRRRRGKRRVSVRIRKAAGERVGKSKVKGIATRRKEKKAQRGEAKRRRAQLPGLTRPEAGSPLVQKETGTRGGQPLGERGAGSGQQPGNPRTIGSEKSLGRVGKGSNQKQQPTRQRAPVGVKQVWNQMRAGIEKEEGVKHNSSQARKVGRGMKPGDGDKAHGMKRAGSKKPVDVKTREGVIRKMIRGKDISK